MSVALHRLVRQETIRQLACWIYDFHKENPLLGLLEPSAAEEIAQELAGAFAANALGLSEQVLTKLIFLTDSPAQTVKIGLPTIQLHRTTPKNMDLDRRISGLLIQALRELGLELVT